MSWLPVPELEAVFKLKADLRWNGVSTSIPEGIVQQPNLPDVCFSISFLDTPFHQSTDPL